MLIDRMRNFFKVGFPQPCIILTTSFCLWLLITKLITKLITEINHGAGGPVLWAWPKCHNQDHQRRQDDLVGQSVMGEIYKILPWTQFQVGGNFGLFTGFSLISGIELLYWIWFKVQIALCYLFFHRLYFTKKTMSRKRAQGKRRTWAGEKGEEHQTTMRWESKCCIQHSSG